MIKVVCYVGLYEPTIARNSVYVEGLKKQGINVVECVDNSSGFKKFFKIAKKYRSVAKQADVIFVAYTSGILVPLMRCISTKPIVYNAAHSLYEGMILDRARYKPHSFWAYYYWGIDFLSFHLSTITLVESLEQRAFISRHFFVPLKKLRVFYTGALPEAFFPDPTIPKNLVFTVVFRGAFLPATGVEYIIEAARLLENEDVDINIFGRGMLEPLIREKIKTYNLSRVTVVTDFLSFKDLRQELLRAHSMFGQFSGHERLERTIQNKTFEALAMGMPYITQHSKSNSEVLIDEKNSLLIDPKNPKALASAIMRLKNDKVLRESIGREAYKLYLEKYTPAVLGKKLADTISESGS